MKSPRVSLHRFRDCAALAILNSDGTVYLDAKGARQLARDMARLARSLEREKFTAHTFKQAQSIPAADHAGYTATPAKES